MTKKAKGKKVTRKTKSRKGPPRECSVCHELGHTARSHEPGGRLAT